jgi:hypothetical protein
MERGNQHLGAFEMLRLVSFLIKFTSEIDSLYKLNRHDG